MIELNRIYNGNCLNVMKNIEDNFIDLVITSPPYNVGVSYDSWLDKLTYEEYFSFMRNVLSELYRCLKPDGRIALNILYEVNFKERGGRVFLVSEIWGIMKKIGYNWAGIADLQEIQPHRVKYTAWGSYLSASSPYIYNPKECVLLAYKDHWKKDSKGKTTITSDEFIEAVSGRWKYMAETKKITMANYSEDIPNMAIKIMSYEGDIVYDPFMGSGTTALACKKLNRNYIGSEISEEYCRIANDRINNIPKELF